MDIYDTLEQSIQPSSVDTSALIDLDSVYVPKVPLISQPQLQVSELIFGAASFGNVYGELGQHEKNAVVESSIRAGINTFDTSAFYGGGLSEKCLGIALQSVPRSDVVICTKMGRTAATHSSGGGGGFDFTAAGLEECIKSSLSRLGVSSIDCLALHDVEFAIPSHLREQALPYLAHLRSTGVCRAIGVTGYPHGLLQELGLQQDVSLDYVVSYNHGTVQNNTVGALTETLASTNVSVWEASPLALGFLADGPTQSWLPLPAQMQALKQAAVGLSQAYGSKLSSTAMQYHLRHRSAHTTMIGAKTVAELQDVLHTWASFREDSASTREVCGQVIRGMFAQLPDRGGQWDQEWNDHSGMDLQYKYPGHDGWKSV